MPGAGGQTLDEFLASLNNPNLSAPTDSSHSSSTSDPAPSTSDPAPSTSAPAPSTPSTSSSSAVVSGATAPTRQTETSSLTINAGRGELSAGNGNHEITLNSEGLLRTYHFGNSQAISYSATIHTGNGNNHIIDTIPFSSLAIPQSISVDCGDGENIFDVTAVGNLYNSSQVANAAKSFVHEANSSTYSLIISGNAFIFTGVDNVLLSSPHKGDILSAGIGVAFDSGDSFVHRALLISKVLTGINPNFAQNPSCLDKFPFFGAILQLLENPTCTEKQIVNYLATNILPDLAAAAGFSKDLRGEIEYLRHTLTGAAGLDEWYQGELDKPGYGINESPAGLLQGAMFYQDKHLDKNIGLTGIPYYYSDVSSFVPLVAAFPM